MFTFGMKVLHLRSDSHTSFKVKRSKVRVTDGRGHSVSAEPGGHTACFNIESFTSNKLTSFQAQIDILFIQ